MDNFIDCGSASPIGAGTAASATGETEARAQLHESTPSFGMMFPSTRYFEVDSEIAGARFAAWVTLPMHYDADQTRRFPVVYQMDGNLFFPSTAPFHQAGASDPMSPLIPFILVSVGYSEPESHAWTWLRVRDLLPPNEPLPDAMLQAVELSVKAGLLPKEDGDRYLTMFTKPAADKFLGFLEKELHPSLAEKFRIDEDEVGIWGDSYGGLFAAYVAVRQSPLFKCVGAGSPGIIGIESQIFRLYDQAIESKQDYTGRRLHISLGARELSDPCIYQWLSARGTGELLARSSRDPLPGLQVSTEIIPLETHVTGAVPAWFSFLRACYGRPREP